MRALALLTALLAAAVLPGEPPGIAVPIVAALMLAPWLRTALRSPIAAVLAGLALALATQAALRDAGWVVALDLAAATGLAAFAAAGPTLIGLWSPFARLRDLLSLAPQPSRSALPYLRGAALGSIVVLPFAVLFLTGDAAFAAFAGELPLPSLSSLPGQALTFALILVGTLGLWLAARRPPYWCALVPRWKLTFGEWAVPLALLDALFLAFVLVQVTVLFGGHDRVLRTSGLTYAEYARSGFWQLLAAAALTLAVVRTSGLFAATAGRAQRRILQALLGGLGGLTLVVLVSALHRLRLYEDAYGLTRARLFVEFVSVWLGGLLVVAVVATIAARRFGNIAILGTAVALLAFTLGDPDRRVAERNVARWHETGRLDTSYLAGLSADAVPALATLPRATRERALRRIRSSLGDPEPWGSANRSRAEARRLLGPSG